MHPSPESPQGEELSFGADPDGGPRLSERATAWAVGWARSHRLLLLVFGLSVALVAGLGVGGWHLYERSHHPLPPPDGPWPQTGRLSVFLCRGTSFEAGWETCDHGAADTADKQRIEAALRTMPELRDIRFKEALTNSHEGSVGEGKPNFIGVPEYEALVVPGDWRELKRRIEALPRVSMVFLHREGFWVDKADIGISLCPELWNLVEYRCKGRGRPTEDEKRAVFDRIKSLPDVEAVYLENPEHYLKMIRHSYWEQDGPATNDVRHLPETFYVKLERPPIMHDVEKAFQGMPGVSGVIDIFRLQR